MYAVGVVAWELLTRCVPWEGAQSVDDLAALAHAHIELDIPDFAPAWWASIIRGCCASTPESRPTAAAALALFAPCSA